MDQDVQTINELFTPTPKDPDVEAINSTFKPKQEDYIVQPGDNLTKISEKFGTTINKISGYSSGDPNMILPGERLKVDDPNTKGALLAGAKPDDLVWAEGELGKKQYEGYCQRFVRLATGGQTSGASAIQAWNNNTDKIEGTLEGIQPGDLLYFSANESNENFGHAGIYSGNGKFISATDNGVKEYNLHSWNKLTAQTPLGYIKRR